MNKNELFQAFGDIDDEILERSEALAAVQASTPRGANADISEQREAPAVWWKTKAVRRWGTIAACTVLAIGIGGAAFTAEAKEYQAAVAFFEENELSTEGLSRSDMKAVYRDITSQSFTYDKTAEVIRQAVPGLELTQQELSSEDPTPEDLAELWNNSISNAAPAESGISYHIDYQERWDETLGYNVPDRSILECYEDGELLWTAEFPDVQAEKSVHTSAGTAVWGSKEIWSDERTSVPWVARVDENGTILWQCQPEHSSQYEIVTQILDNEDGTWAVVSEVEFEYLCLSQYDADGNELCSNKIKANGYYGWKVSRLGDGYLAQLGNSAKGGTSRVVRLDREGIIQNSFTYEGEDSLYYITDMAECGGQVYLSAYAVPKQTDGGGRHEIANILDFIEEEMNSHEWEDSGEKTTDGEWEIRPGATFISSKLTSVVQGNYTALLLLCDPESGTPKTFYSVKGSLGGELDINDAGELTWDVESIVNSFYSPATSAYTIGGTCEMFRYTLDSSGNVLQQENTGKTTPYYR